MRSLADNSADRALPLPALRATNIARTFGNVRAVNNMSLEVQQGEILALLGPNGAGKTTFIDIVLGLQKADTGSVELFGHHPKAAIQRSLVGVVQQTGGLLRDEKVRNVLRVIAATMPNSLSVDQVISLARLEKIAHKRVAACSGGEQQRLRLAIALLPNPNLLILDEPTAGMDVNARSDFWEIMSKQAKQGRTIIFATHYLAEAQEFAGRTVIMNNGDIIADAPTDELRRQHDRREAQITVDTAQKPQIMALLADFSAPSWEHHWEDQILHISGTHIDEVVRSVFTQPGTSNIEVARASLEDIFTEMTAVPVSAAKNSVAIGEGAPQ